MAESERLNHLPKTSNSLPPATKLHGGKLGGSKFGETGITANAASLNPALVAELENNKNLPLQVFLSKQSNGVSSNPDLNRDKFGHGMRDAEQAIRKSPV